MKTPITSPGEKKQRYTVIRSQTGAKVRKKSKRLYSRIKNKQENQS